MTYRIAQTDLRKHRLVTLYSKLPTGAYTVSDHVERFLDSDRDNGRATAVEEIQSILNAARQSFKKGKFVVSLEDACAHYNVYDTFLDVRNGVVDYHAAFQTAFDYAAVLYMKSVKDVSIVDGATFAILARRSQLMDFEMEEDTNDFDEMIRAMLAEIDGTQGKVNTPMSDIVTRHDYLLYLLMPRLDHRVVKTHRAIYNAFVTGDSAAFDAILDAA